MSIRVLRLMEYVYDSPETAAADMAKWTHGRHDRAVQMRSATLPFEALPFETPAGAEPPRLDSPGGDAHHLPRDKHGREILTVGQLRTALQWAPPDTQVVVDDGSGWYINVGELIVPEAGGGGEYMAVTLMHGAPFDARQG